LGEMEKERGRWGMTDGGEMEVVGDEVLTAEGVVERLHRGELDVKELEAGARRECVEYLTREGFSGSEISRLMRISERTVRRDRAANRRERMVEPGVRLGDELLGELEEVTAGANQRLMRLAREAGTPAYARLWAEEAIVKNYQRFVETARRMKYVEEGSRRIAEERENDPEARRQTRQRMREGMELVKWLAGAGEDGTRRARRRHEEGD
jgi:hypothetical protein